MTDPVFRRMLPDDREITVWPMLFNHRLCAGDPGALYYHDAWCYPDRESAVRAARQWDGNGEPLGWIKHPATGRYRPDGTPASEVSQR